jgi:DNA repair photolyase
LIEVLDISRKSPGKKVIDLKFVKRLNNTDLYETHANTNLLTYRRLKKKGSRKGENPACAVFYEYTLNTIRGVCDGICRGCTIGRLLVYKPYFEKNACVYWRSALKKLKLSRSDGNPMHIYVQSAVDLFLPSMPDYVIYEILEKLCEYPNFYYFVTKYPHRFLKFYDEGKIPPRSMVGITTESDHVVRYKKDDAWIYYTQAPGNINRLLAAKEINLRGINAFLSIAPFFIPDNLENFISMIIETGIQKVTLCANQNPYMDDELQSQLVTSPYLIRDLVDELGKHDVVSFINRKSAGVWHLEYSETPQKPVFILWSDKEQHEQCFKLK